MLTYIIIISLIILIIAIYQYKNNVIPEDNIQGFHIMTGHCQNIPQNPAEKYCLPRVLRMIIYIFIIIKVIIQYYR